MITTVVIVGTTAMLLAYTQGLSLRTARRALRGEPSALSEVPPLRTDDDAKAS